MHKIKANYGERSAPREALFIVDYVQKCNCTNYEVPTGNLDTENEEKIVELLISLAHDRGFTVVMVTHNRQIADRADVRLVMKDGRMQVLSERGVSITGLAGQ